MHEGLEENAMRQGSRWVKELSIREGFSYSDLPFVTPITDKQLLMRLNPCWRWQHVGQFFEQRFEQHLAGTTSAGISITVIWR